MAFDKATSQDSFVYASGYQDTVKNIDGADIPNPESKKVFAQRMIDQFVSEIVASYEAHKASDSARITKLDEVKAADIKQGDVTK